MPTIGAKNRLIELWKPSAELDSVNIPVGWELYKSRWAEVAGETGMTVIRAASEAQGINTQLVRYSFRINYTRGIDANMQVRDRTGNRFNIIAVRNDEAGRQWTDIIAELGGANG